MINIRSGLSHLVGSDHFLSRAMAESFQYKALLECYDSLVTALKLDPASLADALATKGLVPPGKITNQPGTEADQARVLAGCILDRVKLVPSRYYDVVDIMSKYQWMEDFVRILKTTAENKNSKQKKKN